ncbi:DUF1634 domain-containing protein [Gordonia sp. DT218]|uniref:DUF1634 domain-containing protein n=1 Tax=Gordonia sp. DT218 TaxID=3416659 RepID=UPI003CEF23AF
MKQNPVITTNDQRLAGRLATLMRVGTVSIAMLLVAGTVCSWTDADVAATILLSAGCGLLVLLPVVRLVMMVDHFARSADKPFVVITALVLVLIAAGALIG